MTPDKVGLFVQVVVVSRYVECADYVIRVLDDRGRPLDVAERLGVGGIA